MAYSRTRKSGSTRRAKSAGGRTYRARASNTGRRSYGRTSRSKRSTSGARTIRIVVEQAPANTMARPTLATLLGKAPAPAPRKAVF